MSSMEKKATGSSGGSSGASTAFKLPPAKGFVVLTGIDETDPDGVVKALVELRKEKGWSSRLFTLHSLKGSEGLYEEWCSKLSSEVRRLRLTSSSHSPVADDADPASWAKVVPGQFDDA